MTGVQYMSCIHGALCTLLVLIRSVNDGNDRMVTPSPNNGLFIGCSLYHYMHNITDLGICGYGS